MTSLWLPPDDAWRPLAVVSNEDFQRASQLFDFRYSRLSIPGYPNRQFLIIHLILNGYDRDLILSSDGHLSGI
jgi:hypothetical protein